MADFIRGLRWRAAWMVLSLALILLWYGAFTGRGYIVRIDFTFVVTEAIDAEVVIDGVVVDTLAMLRRQPINGIRVSKGDHTVVLRTEYCDGRPFDVMPERYEKTVSLFVHLNEGTVDGRFVCTLWMRR